MKLLLFVPCEKLIVDELGNPTLISILQDIGIEIPEGEKLPDNLVVPKEWDVVTLWKAADSSEIGKKLVQKTQFVNPVGAVTFASAIPFDVPSLDKTQRNKLHINGFPATHAGPLTIRMWLETSDSKHVSETHEYPIQISHKRVPVQKPAPHPV